ncbi:MAG: hypothetical protein HFH88_17000 [Lachnospiraceae bacterium]|nr:hypothetical protein [Lachnospiraceae bacterium]
MVKKRYIQAAACLLTACMLLCGCGERDGALLIGNLESQDTGNRTAEGGERERVGEENEVPKSGHGEGQAAELRETTIRVYVCGAVTNPGVVEIPEGSRAEDALAAAGGFAPEAGREAVNLAEWVKDGQMLYFPTEGEAEMQKAREEDAAAGLVNINTADAAGLCTLPGVGESRAADIIAYREANGGFESCEDIMKVTGIKEAMYQKIKDRITVK